MTSSPNDDQCYAKLDSGEVIQLSLEQLQDAFEAGRVHANTYILQAGDDQWRRLGEVAGLDEEASASPSGAEPAGAPQHLQQIHASQPGPVLAHPQQAAAQHFQQPAPQQPQGAQYFQQTPAQPAQPGAQYFRQTAQPAAARYFQESAQASPRDRPQHQSAPHAAQRQALNGAAGGAFGAFPPVVAAKPAAASAEPPGLDPSAGPELAALVDQQLAAGFKASRTKLIAMATAGLAVIGGLGFVLTRNEPEIITPPTTTTQAPLMAAPTPSKYEESEPAARSEPSKAEGSSKDSASGNTGRFSDDMKRALIEADKKRATQVKKRARTPGPSRPAAGGGRQEAATTFSKGGNAYDPLNGL